MDRGKKEKEMDGTCVHDAKRTRGGGEAVCEHRQKVSEHKVYFIQTKKAKEQSVMELRAK
jgi:hypothetical protein